MKYSRHSKILELIQGHEIETQEELAQKLRDSGFNVTQATVSRDIKELRLIKSMTKGGKYKYASIKQQEGVVNERFLRLFKDSVLSLDSAGNIIVIRTLVGAANAAAVAIDALDFPGIIGTIAGDDTIFLLVKNTEDLDGIKEKFNELID